MDVEEKKLAEAAGRLTVGDFRYLQQHGMLPEAEASKAKAEKGASQKNASQEAASHRETASHQNSASQSKKRRTRRARKHAWPPVGATLEADYHGTRYEAEVVEARRYKSGRAVKVLTGPAAGKVFSSLSGAMIAATETQRQEQGLGHKGVSNGWGFWRPAEGGPAHEQND